MTKQDEYQARHEAHKKAGGEVQVRVWVPSNKRDELRTLAAEWRREVSTKKDVNK